MKRCLYAVVFMFIGLPTAHAATCTYGPLPEIEITSSESQSRFSYDLSQAQLKAFKGNADIPMAAVYDLTVNAMSTGKMRVTRDVTFIKTPMPKNQTCLQAAKIRINIHIDPLIYIAKELRNEACEYKAYLVHELKHIEEDKRLIEDYKAIIRRNMAFAFPESKDYSVGPIPVSITKDAQRSLTANITGALQATIDSMLRERAARQRTIDSTGEYIRLTRECLQGKGHN